MTEHKLPARYAPLTPRQIAEKESNGHSLFGPSGAEMTMTCAESLVLNALAEDVQTFEAAEGTVAHSCAEGWLKSGERPDHWIGYVEEVRGWEIEITEEMLGFVQDFIDECDPEGWDETWAEKHVDVSHLTPIPKQGGTGDFIAVKPGKGKVVDLKYGKDPVFAFYADTGVNKQLASYASGIFRELDWLYGFQEIEIVIVQPRLPGGTTRYTISRAELLEFEKKAKAAWARSWLPERTRTPSIKGCRWCKVRQTCPALYLFMSQSLNDTTVNYDEEDGIIDAEFTEVEMEEANALILDEFSPSPFPKLPKPAELSTAALAKLLRYRKLMETFFNALAEELLDRGVSKEEDIPWWKIVESRTLRRYVDDEEWIIEQLVGKGLKKSDLYESKLLSPAKVERLLHTKLKMKLADAKRWLEESGMTVKPPGRKTLAAMSDPREALPKDGDFFCDYDAEEDDI